MRILLVTAVPPGPASGGGRRTDLLLKSLGQLGTVDVAGLGPRWSMPSRARAGDQGGVFIDLTASGTARRGLALRERLGPVRFRLNGWEHARRILGSGHREHPWDLTVSRYIHAFASVGGLPGAPSLVDIDDLPSEVRATSGSSSAPGTYDTVSRSRDRLTARRLAPAERACIARADGVWVSAPVHARLLGRDDAIWLPNALAWPKGEPERPAPHRPPTALFLGPLWHDPNRVGLTWLLEHVWPLVRARVPAARLLVAGEGTHSSPSPAEGIQMLGFVPDLDELYSQVDVALAPLYSGSGTSLKVLEALGRGRPCLATPFAARHLGEVAPESVLRVREPARWADDLVWAFQQRLWLGESARRSALDLKRACNPERFLAGVEELVRRVAPLESRPNGSAAVPLAAGLARA